MFACCRRTPVGAGELLTDVEAVAGGVGEVGPRCGGRGEGDECSEGGCLRVWEELVEADSAGGEEGVG